MQVRSTLNIDSKIFEKITSAAELCDVSRNKLINLLFTRFHEKSNYGFKDFQRVSYQKSENNTVWKKFHVGYDADVYEICIDLRKWCKNSVSKILMLAVGDYLGEVMDMLMGEDIPEKSDNYVIRFSYFTRKPGKTANYSLIWGFTNQESPIIDFTET